MGVPHFIAPQLATLVEAPPQGSDWLHETKFDGYRAIASVGDGRAVIRTRNGLDWTKKFPSLVGPLSSLRCKSAVLDGEIAVAGEGGHTDFGALQNAISEGRGKVRYYLFDLLQLDGEDLRALPLIERKEKLRHLLSRSGKSAALHFSRHVRGHGDEAFRRACRQHLEGIVSKRATDRYRSARTMSWLKSKCGIEQEFVVIGWRPSSKRDRPFSSILLATRDHGKLRYCGRVGTGYTQARLGDLAEKFRRNARQSPPVRDIPPAIARHAKFLKPVLVAEVALRGWTRDGMIRQGSFKGLRSDKPARSVVKETPMPTAKAVKRSGAQRARKTATRRPARKASSKKGSKSRGAKVPVGGAPEVIKGVRVTHPDRDLYSGEGVTKRDLIDYYTAVAERMLPYIAGRPLALVRCPHGAGGEHFFQKHANPGWPDAFKKIRIREKSGAGDYLYITSVSGLVAAAQMDVLELHIWECNVDDIERPDRLVFDLDPGEGVSFAQVKEAARGIRKRLEELGLQSFPMLTGGKGIHVIAPVSRRHGWDEHRDFSHAFARHMEEEKPALYIANMSKAKRRGRVFVDYLRNQRGATAIAPFSTRARKGAHVAWPVSWEGLGGVNDAGAASVKNAMRKLPKADPWKGYGAVRQTLPVKKLLG